MFEEASRPRRATAGLAVEDLAMAQDTVGITPSRVEALVLFEFLSSYSGSKTLAWWTRPRHCHLWTRPRCAGALAWRTHAAEPRRSSLRPRGEGRCSPSGPEEKGAAPATPLVLFGVEPTERGSRAGDAPCTPRAMAALAHAEEPWHAARRVFPGDSSQPGRSLAAVLARGHVAHRGEEGGGRHRATPRHGLQALTCGMGLTSRGQLL